MGQLITNDSVAAQLKITTKLLSSHGYSIKPFRETYANIEQLKSGVYVNIVSILNI